MTKETSSPKGIVIKFQERKHAFKWKNSGKYY